MKKADSGGMLGECKGVLVSCCEGSSERFRGFVVEKTATDPSRRPCGLNSGASALMPGAARMVLTRCIPYTASAVQCDVIRSVQFNTLISITLCLEFGERKIIITTDV